MRVAVVAWGSGAPGKLRPLAQAVSAGLQAQGHQSAVIFPPDDQDRLTVFQYVILLTESANILGSKVPPGLPEWLSRSGLRPGTRGAVFVRNRLIGAYRSLRLAMGAMEKEGCYLTFNDIVSKPADAEAIARSLDIG